MKYVSSTLTLLLAAAAAGPAAADLKAPRKNRKLAGKAATNPVDGAPRNLLAEEDMPTTSDMITSKDEDASCADDFFNVGMQETVIAALTSEFVWVAFHLDEEFPCDTLTKQDLRARLNLFPTLSALKDAIKGAGVDIITQGEFAGQISGILAPYSCKEFQDFLDAGEGFREVVAEWRIALVGDRWGTGQVGLASTMEHASTTKGGECEHGR